MRRTACSATAPTTKAADALKLDDQGLLGNAGNRLQEAQALSLHLINEMQWGRWTFTPGLRYEDIDQRRTRWEIRAGRTANPASRAADNLRSSRRNQTRVWLPGAGAIYSLTDRLTLFGGVHKGFTAPTNAPGVDEETALNYEAGGSLQWRTAQCRSHLVPQRL